MRQLFLVGMVAISVLLLGCIEEPETGRQAKTYCGQDDVVGRYQCQEGISKVVYSTPGTGYKLVKTDGTEIPCPVVAPDAMSEECKKALEEGYCSEENSCPGGGVGLANPAAVYCEEQGGTLRGFNGSEGAIGVCEFTNGSACKQWDYYNGECSPGDCEVMCEFIGQDQGWSLVCGDHGEVLEITNCGKEPDSEPEPEPTPEPEPEQPGIYGTVTLIGGNCMPPVTEGCQTTQVLRTVYIREPATMSDMDVTYLINKTTLVEQVTSDANGFYEVELPPGTYSIFVEDDGKEYCNSFGGQGEACQFTVTEGSWEEHNVSINHAAW